MTENPSPSGAPRAELVIEAGRTEQQYWRDLWHFRELFYILAWRDIVVRYKQTVIGIAWAAVAVLRLGAVGGKWQSAIELQLNL